MSDMDSECDDVFTDDAKSCGDKDLKDSSGGDDDGRHVINRKRRRGIIEKRRRDRINNSLTELRRLVPAAFEKQGSAKLEKAEILQMTVDHLRILHSKGPEVFSFEHFSPDYHGIGFRECASEAARYLSSFEGLELQHPLRLRLLSHLQCFQAQRDHPSLFAPSPLYPLPSSKAVLATKVVLGYPSCKSMDELSPTSRSSQSPGYPSSALSSSSRSVHSPGYTSSVPSPSSRTSQSPGYLSSMLSSSSRGSVRDTHMFSCSSSRPSSAGSSMSTETSSSGGSRSSSFQLPVSPLPLLSRVRQEVKPYRPWGAEMAY